MVGIHADSNLDRFSGSRVLDNICHQRLYSRGIKTSLIALPRQLYIAFLQFLERTAFDLALAR